MSIGNLEFIDGGALHYDVSTAQFKWNQFSGWTRLPTNSPWGGPVIQTGGGMGYSLTYGPPTNLYMGVRGKLYPPSGTNFNSRSSIFSFNDIGSSQVSIAVEVDGHISARLGSTSALIGLSTESIHINTFYYFEAFVLVHPSAGQVIVRLNNVEIINVSGVNTRSTLVSEITNITLGGQAADMRAEWCDFYIHKTQFLGDIRIGLMKPNADNTNSGWFLSTGSFVWPLVDEVPPNTTDYAYATAAGSVFYTEMEDVILTGPCLGIQVLSLAEKEDSGDRQGKSVIVEGGTQTDGVETPITATTPLYLRDTYEENPRTSAPWTEAQLNAIKAGLLLSV